MRISAELWSMMLLHFFYAMQHIEAKRADAKAMPTGLSLQRLRECSFGGEKPDFRETYPCVHDKGEDITRVVDGEKVHLKKFCRVRSERFNEKRFADKLDDATSLVMRLAKASGITKTETQLKEHIESAKVNIWMEKSGGELISHSAFYAKAEPNATCAVGEVGSLALAPDWQGKQLAKESDLLIDIAYDLGYMAFYATTKVTNLESLRTQRRLDSPVFRFKKMGTIFGYLEALFDLAETQPMGTVFVALMSPTGGFYSCLHNKLEKKFVHKCGPVVMSRFLDSGKYKEVNFTRADMLRQVQLDPETPERALRVLTSSLNKVLDL